ncbi:RmlC-like jelly roll fold [Phaffia rhodozyma]|uniref:RmlC-like jelly roll fold n=1 Tax=Phaffia rhodozyma TaxID=264483 RepID=A0A0F7SMV2_PHARH|nr:RmlC-like jelly roll fold [Phaffia rhodozyma]
MTSSRTIVKAVRAIAQAEGAGAVVKRSIGSSSLRSLSPFLMLDEFAVGKDAGFPDHPHRGMATVTYLLEGQFEHEDFAGHRGKLGPGDLQWMIAGRGIVHAEMPVVTKGGVTPRGLQLWIDLPEAEKDCEPDYQEQSAQEISTAHPSEDVEIRVISGESHGVNGKVRHKGGCHYYDIRLKSPTSSVFQTIPQGWTAFIYTLTGSLQIGDQTHPASTTLVLSSQVGQDGVEIKAAQAEGETRFVLIAGEPLNQPVVQHGPFVVTSRAKVIEAFRDYQFFQNGFERAKGWANRSFCILPSNQHVSAYMSPSHDEHEKEKIHRVEYPAIASQEDMKAHRLPLAYRDLCSKHLITLNQCRKAEYFLPWKCHAEKEDWEICQYKDFLRRMRKATRLRAEAKEDGSGPIPLLDTVRTLNAVKAAERNQED